MKNKHRQLFLSLIASDRTYESLRISGEQVWAGRCIHCNKKLLFSLSGEPLSEGSLEHILPQTHGGTDDLNNLAIACKRCNHQKGKRHDCKPLSDEGLQNMIALLQQRKKERLA
jgi:5-methylcytosine-specific restriction endonuclease McrA